LNAITDQFTAQTGRSRALQERARAALPGGSSRTVGWHRPYPVVFERGEGPYLFDVDGRRYVDYLCNGLSLIHGHAYPPVVQALRETLDRGTALPQASRDQLEFAELLRDRLPHGDLVRFTGTGTEAAMLAVKVARAHTGRPIVVKAWDGYHGSFDDLEVGLGGREESPGRVALARFGDLADFERVLAEHSGQVACVILESVMFTGLVAPPPEKFLNHVQDLCRREDVLFVLDDCLMLRLAVGGSQERFGLDPDLTVLGKFIGGGLPVGAVVGRSEVMSILDPYRPDGIAHGGSFNGFLLGMVAGRVAMQELTADRIVAMEQAADTLRDQLPGLAARHGVPFSMTGFGSALGVYADEQAPASATERTNEELWQQLHLALLNNGMYLGAEGEMAMTTLTSNRIVEETVAGFEAAFVDLAPEVDRLTTGSRTGSHQQEGATTR
jgi:glutamate-1-semialdehyde 2,1-aminomutase